MNLLRPFTLLLDAIYIIGITLAFLFFMAHLTKRHKSLQTYLLIIFYLCVFFMVLGAWNSDLTYQYKWPHLSLIEVPFVWLVGPTLYLLSRYIEEGRLSVRFLPLHLLPTLFVSIYMISYFAKPPVWKATRLVEIFVRNHVGAEEIIYGCGVFASSSYILYLVIRYIPFLTQQKTKEKKMLIFLMLSATVAMIGMLSVILQSFSLIKVAAAMICLSLILHFVLHFHDPDYYKILAQTLQNHRFQSHLKGLDVDNILTRLDGLMETEKIFLDEDITLEQLAEVMVLSRHQLSELINRYKRKNFREYINEYRIKEAIRILEETTDVGLLDLGYKVGFGSNSAFYTAFKKYTGCTPKKYIKTRINIV